jgi:hypothetical protein
MKRARLTEDQIIGVSKEHEAGAKRADLARKHGVGRRTYGKRSFGPQTQISPTNPASWRYRRSILPPRANMRPRRRSCSDSSMGTTSTSRADMLSSPSAFSCRCKPSRGSKWPETSPTLSQMNFGADESRGRRRRISRSPARPGITHSIVSEERKFRRPG